VPPAGAGQTPCAVVTSRLRQEILRDHRRMAGQHSSAAARLAWPTTRGKRTALPLERRRWHVRPGLPSAHSLCRAARHGGHRSPVPMRCGRLPWLASRGWSRVGARLPCPNPQVR